GGLQGVERNRLSIGQFEEVAGGGVDDGEGIVDFMGDATGHQADSGEACGGDGLDAVEFDFFFHALALGDVASGGEDAADFAVGVPVEGGVVKDVGEATLRMKEGQGIVGDKAFGEHTAVTLTGFFGLGEVIGKIGAKELSSGNACDFCSGRIDIGDFPLGANGDQGIEGSLDQAAGVEGSVAQLPFGLKAGGIVREGNNGGVGSFAGLVEHRLGTDEEPTDRVIGLFDTHVDVRDRLAGAKSKDDGIVFRKKRRAVLMDGGGLPVGGSATEEKARGNAEGTFRASVTSDDGAVGLLNDDTFGHGGDDGAVAFFTLAEGQLIQTAFNGDAGELDAEIDEVLFGGNGSAGLAGVDGEGAEDVSLMRKNGRGPAGAKIMTFDQFAEVFPERIFEDVCNDDTLFAVHGSAAGAGAGPDGEAVNGADVGFGEAGSGAVAEVPAVLIQKEEGTKETGELQLDQAHESRESAVEGGTGGDHFEEPGLDGEQAFGAFAMGEVADDFGGTHDVTGVILDGGNRERDVEKTAVLMLAERFEMFDAFTAREALADGDFLGLEAWGKEDGDGAADDFLGTIAEEAFGAGIPGLDDAVEV